MIKPLLHRVIVLPDPVETKTESGIIVAINEKREQAAADVGTVVSIGPTVFKHYDGDPSDIVIGNRVAYAKYAGKTIKDVDGKEYTILNDEDIVAIIRED